MLVGTMSGPSPAVEPSKASISSSSRIGGALGSGIAIRRWIAAREGTRPFAMVDELRMLLCWVVDMDVEEDEVE